MKHFLNPLTIRRVGGMPANSSKRFALFRVSVAVPLILLFGAAFGQPHGAYKKSDGKTIAVVTKARTSDLRVVEYETGLIDDLKQAENSTYKLAKNSNITYRFSGDSLVVANTVNKKLSYVAMKLNLPETDVMFSNKGLTLYGRLVLPKGKGKEKFPLVVIVQGSDNQSAIDTYEEPYIFASQGIACFIYDKRGTGRSQDISDVSLRTNPSFPMLASDVAAAVDTLSHFGQH